METINYKINVDTKGAVKETDKLSDSLKQVDKEAEKTSTGIKDVGENGGAIAILDSLTGGLATRFRDAYEATKLFNFSLKGTRTALIATGVGAFVIILGTIVAYWSEINDAIKGVTENLQTQLDLTKAVQSNLDLQVKNIDKQIELGKLQGKTNEQLEAQKVALLQRLQEQNTAEQQLIEKQLARLKATATEVSFWDSIVANVKFTLFGAQGLADTATKLSGERLAAIKALEDQLEAAKGQAIDLELTLFKIANPEQEEQKVKETPFELENGLTPEDNIILGSKELLNEKLLELDKEYSDEIAQRAQNEILAAEAAAQERIFLEEQVKNAKIGIAFQTLGLLGSLAKEGSALAKGAAVAQATISGFQGAQNAFTTAAANPITTLFPAFPFIQAGLAGAFSLAQINKILSTKAVETSAPSLGGGGGGRSAPAPSFNLVQGSATNQLSQSLQRSNEPIKAYVVSKDMTNKQELDRTIQQSAVL